MYNLFIEHHTILQDLKGKSGIGRGWEDDFTNILSFYLSFDYKALKKFCRYVLGKDYEKPVAIENQVATSKGRPDIVITLKSGSKLIVECKVDATLQKNQLERYLEIESNNGCQTYVALFTKKPLNVPSAVINNPKYKSPPQSQHYFWTDLFHIIPKTGKGEIGIGNARWFFRHYIELLGFSPSSLKADWFKIFEPRTIEENQKVQREFGRKLSLTRKWLTNHDFNVTAISHSGLQAVPKSGIMKVAGIYFLVIAPAKSRKDLIPREVVENLNNEVLRVAIVYNTLDIPEQAWDIYKSFPMPYGDSHGHLWWPTKPYKFSKSRVRLEFVSNLSKFLEEEEEIEMRINDGCRNVIELIFSLL